MKTKKINLVISSLYMPPMRPSLKLSEMQAENPWGSPFFAHPSCHRTISITPDEYWYAMAHDALPFPDYWYEWATYEVVYRREFDEYMTEARIKHHTLLYVGMTKVGYCQTMGQHRKYTKEMVANIQVYLHLYRFMSQAKQHYLVHTKSGLIALAGRPVMWYTPSSPPAV